MQLKYILLTKQFFSKRWIIVYIMYTYISYTYIIYIYIIYGLCVCVRACVCVCDIIILKSCDQSSSI